MLGKIGFIGGMGWIGSAILKQMLVKRFVDVKDVWVAVRSHKRNVLEDYPDIHITHNNHDLSNHCDTIVLCVRPQDFSAINVRLDKHLVISMMAGVSVKQIRELCFAKYVVRAMPNAAVTVGESYTPLFC